MSFITRLGIIRSLFLLLVIIVICAAPLALKGVKTDTLYDFMTTIFIPSMVPMLFFLLPMDMTMCRAIQDGQSEKVRNHYGKIVKLELVLWLLMILAWVPFILSITR